MENFECSEPYWCEFSLKSGIITVLVIESNSESLNKEIIQKLLLENDFELWFKDDPKPCFSVMSFPYGIWREMTNGNDSNFKYVFIRHFEKMENEIEPIFFEKPAPDAVVDHKIDYVYLNFSGLPTEQFLST